MASPWPGLPLLRVEGFHLALLRHDTLLRESLAAVRHPRLLREGLPRTEGVLDPRKGAIDGVGACATCGETSACPGHISHLPLAAVCFHPSARRTLLRVAQSCCHACGRLLAPPEEVAASPTPLATAAALGKRLSHCGYAPAERERVWSAFRVPPDDPGYDGKRAAFERQVGCGALQFCYDLPANNALRIRRWIPSTACVQEERPGEALVPSSSESSSSESSSSSGASASLSDASDADHEETAVHRFLDASAQDRASPQARRRFEGRGARRRKRMPAKRLARGKDWKHFDCDDVAFATRELLVQVDAISTSTCALLGFGPGVHPRDLFLRALAVPGNHLMPSAQMAQRGVPVDGSALLQQTVRIVEASLRIDQCRGDLRVENASDGGAEKRTKYEGGVRPRDVRELADLLRRAADPLEHRSADIPGQPGECGASNALAESIQRLQFEVSVLLLNRFSPGSLPPFVRGLDRSQCSLREWLSGKRGWIRRQMQGKHPTQTGRAVITPDPWIDASCTRVPETMLQTLHVRERVTASNWSFLQRLVRSTRYPRALAVEDSRGRRVELVDANRSMYRLRVGDVVWRDSGVEHRGVRDMLILNRQPTMEISNLIALDAIPSSSQAIALNEAAVTMLKGDFDGDTVSVHAPLLPSAREEMHGILSLTANPTTPQTGAPAAGVLLNGGLGLYRLTDPSWLFDRSGVLRLLGVAKYWNAPRLPAPRLYVWEPNAPRPTGLWTGKQIVSELLPPCLHYVSDESKAWFAPALLTTRPMRLGSIRTDAEWMRWLCTQMSGSAHTVVLRGQLLLGQLHKRVIGDKPGNLYHLLVDRLGRTIAMRGLSDLQRLGVAALDQSGYCLRPDELVRPIETAISARVQQALGAVDCHPLLQPGKGEPLEQEAARNRLLGDLRQNAGGILSFDVSRPTRLRHHTLAETVSSGFRASHLHVVQLQAVFGQAYLRGARLAPRYYGGRTGWFQAPADVSARARGFVRSSFVRGLSAAETELVAMDARTAFVDQAMKISSTCYAERRARVGTENLVLDEQHGVRDLQGGVVVFRHCSTDPQWALPNAVPLLALTEEHVRGECSDATEADALWRCVCALARDSEVHQRYHGQVLLPCHIPSVVRERRERQRRARPRAAAVDSYALRSWRETLVLQVCSLQVSNCVSVEAAVRYCTRSSVLAGADAPCLSGISADLLQAFAQRSASLGAPVGVLASQSISESDTQATFDSFHRSGQTSAASLLAPTSVASILSLRASTRRVLILRAHAPAERCRQEVGMQTLSDNLQEVALSVQNEPVAGCLRTTAVLRLRGRWDRRHVLRRCNALFPQHVVWVYRGDALVLYVRKQAPMVATYGITDDVSGDVVGWSRMLYMFGNAIVLAGVPGVRQAFVCEKRIRSTTRAALLVQGGRLRDLLRLPFVDEFYSYSEDPREMQELFGIDAAHTLTLFLLRASVDAIPRTPLLDSHIRLMARVLSTSGQLLPLNRHGFKRRADMGVLAHAAFEDTLPRLLEAACKSEHSACKGVTDCIQMGIPIRAGTGVLQIDSQTSHEPGPHTESLLEPDPALTRDELFALLHPSASAAAERACFERFYDARADGIRSPESVMAWESFVSWTPAHAIPLEPDASPATVAPLVATATTTAAAATASTVAPSSPPRLDADDHVLRGMRRIKPACTLTAFPTAVRSDASEASDDEPRQATSQQGYVVNADAFAQYVYDVMEHKRLFQWYLEQIPHTRT